LNKSLIAALNDADRVLVFETERDELASLDEDQVVELHTRVRRARNKYLGQYRRSASARVPLKGARGQARAASTRAALKVEAFEEALSRVSRRLAVLAAESAKSLRIERIEAARAAKWGSGHSSTGGTPVDEAVGHRQAVDVNTAVGDRSRRSPTSEKARASTQAAGARRQIKRDRRNSG
jgi:hypothetical protein